jgi:hypothetical protein
VITAAIAEQEIEPWNVVARGSREEREARCPASAGVGVPPVLATGVVNSVSPLISRR